MTRLKDINLYEEAKSQYGWELVSSGKKYKKYMKEGAMYTYFAEMDNGNLMTYAVNKKGVATGCFIPVREMEYLIARAKECM